MSGESISVAVAGLPSWQIKTGVRNLYARVGKQEHPLRGVGKSCLCSRFVRPAHDDYLATNEDHRTQLSGREYAQLTARDPHIPPEVNSSAVHWLYFGSVRKRLDGGSALFNVVEHTTFYSEEGKVYQADATERYLLRATAQTLRAPVTRTYFHTGLLDAPPEPPNCTTLPPFAGFLFALDPTGMDYLEEQLQLFVAFAAQVHALNKPLAVVMTKCDVASAGDLRFAEQRIVKSSTSLSSAVPYFHISARQGIGVERPFRYLLARHKGQGPVADLCLSHTYSDSVAARRRAERRARQEVRRLLEKHVRVFTTSWLDLLSSVAADGDDGQRSLFALYVLLGSEACFEMFQVRLVHMKVEELQSEFRSKLIDALSHHPARPDVLAGKRIGSDDRDRLCCSCQLPRLINYTSAEEESMPCNKDTGALTTSYFSMAAADTVDNVSLSAESLGEARVTDGFCQSPTSIEASLLVSKLSKIRLTPSAKSTAVKSPYENQTLTNSKKDRDSMNYIEVDVSPQSKSPLPTRSARHTSPYSKVSSVCLAEWHGKGKAPLPPRLDFPTHTDRSPAAGAATKEKRFQIADSPNGVMPGSTFDVVSPKKTARSPTHEIAQLSPLPRSNRPQSPLPSAGTSCSKDTSGLPALKLPPPPLPPVSMKARQRQPIAMERVSPTPPTRTTTGFLPTPPARRKRTQPEASAKS